MAKNPDLHSSDQPMTRLTSLAQGEEPRGTLSDIGDGVVTVDTAGSITFLNAVAQSLTGWTQADAAGVHLEVVVCMINETSRKPIENPAARVLRDGIIVGLANSSVLIAKDGTERSIEDMPLRSATMRARSSASYWSSGIAPNDGDMNRPCTRPSPTPRRSWQH